MVALALVVSDKTDPDATQAAEGILHAQAPLGGTVRLRPGTPVAMGVRARLLLPEDVYDAQPIHDSQAGLTMIADLRLDNREDLTRKLAIDGTGLSDSAILLASFRKWGRDCVEHLVGDFAFAVHEQQSGAVFFARDPIGRRPLCLHQAGRFFALASVPNAFSGLPTVPRGVDTERLAERLALVMDDARATLFQRVDMVPPGHAGTYRAGDVRITRWWDPRDVPKVRFKKNTEYVDAAREVLQKAVVSNLRTCGGIAAHLSSGLDSSAVATTAAIALQNRGQRLLALTAAPRKGYKPDFWTRKTTDEAPLATATAALYPNIDHQIVHTPRRDLFDDLDRAASASGHPTANPSNSSWWREIGETAAAHGATALLTGQLGNLTLTYDAIPLYAEDVLSGRAGRAVARMIPGILSLNLGPRALIGQVIVPSVTFGLPRLAATAWWRRVAGRWDSSKGIHFLVGDDLADRYGIPVRAQRAWSTLHDRDQLGCDAQRLRVLSRQRVALAEKADLALDGIDLRDPTADRRMVEFCFAIPPEQFLLRGQRRSLAKRVLADRVPRQVLGMRTRGLQSADFGETLARSLPELLEEVDAIAAWSGDRNLVRTERLKKLFEDAVHGPPGVRQKALKDILAVGQRVLSAGRMARRMDGGNR